jgi:hypothetical protein
MYLISYISLNANHSSLLVYAGLRYVHVYV